MASPRGAATTRRPSCVSCSSFLRPPERAVVVAPTASAPSAVCDRLLLLPNGRQSSAATAGAPRGSRVASVANVWSAVKHPRPLTFWGCSNSMAKARTVCSAAANASETNSSRCSSSAPFSPSKQPQKPSAAGGASTSSAAGKKMMNGSGGDSSSAPRNTATEAMGNHRSIAPLGDSESSNGKASACASAVVANEVPVRRRRGRPPGIPAWNKDKKMSAKTREKISKTKKAQWKDPEYRKETYQAFNTVGREPWNKGKAMSEEARQKMAEAKRGRALSKAVKRKLSLAHSRRPGPGHTPETRAALSAKLSGKRKSPAHRAAIAAGQRRRSAAARVLAAVEGVHRELSDNQASTGGHSSSYEAAARRSSRGGMGGYSAASPTKAQLLGAYKAQLHEYRNLQEELQPWTTAFTNKEGKKPSLRDVEATGIDWLIVKYKQYILLREHLLRDVPSLRQAGRDSGAYGAPGSTPGRSSNSVMGSPSSREAASRMQLAADYRTKMMLRQQGKASSLTTEEEAEEGEDDGERRGEARLRNMVSNLNSSGTNQRASSALQAALSYREGKAKLTSAKARAAAAMAGGGGPSAKAAAKTDGSNTNNVKAAANTDGSSTSEVKDTPTGTEPK